MEFSDCHGENVQLAVDRTSAKWKISYSGGLIFSEYNFQQNDVMNIMLNESGHVDVGYCYVDPDVEVDFRKLIQEMIVIREIRVHKVSTGFELQRPEGDQIIFNIDNKRHETPLPLNKRVWILIYIKFGNLTVTIDRGSERCKRFHSKCGENIRLNPRRRSASLINPKPTALCCLSRKIHQGDTVKLIVNALQVNNKTPSRYHLVLGYSTLDPRELQDRDPGSFRLDDTTLFRRMDRVSDSRGSRKWNVVRLLDKSDCEGYLSIMFTQDCKLIYSVEGKDKQEFQIPYENVGILLVFELWRTRIEISFLSSPPNSDYLTPQSAIRKSKHLPDQSYLYVGPPKSTDLPSISAPTSDMQSLAMSSQSSMPLDEVDAQLASGTPVSPHARFSQGDGKELEETLVKSTSSDSIKDTGRYSPEQSGEKKRYANSSLERRMEHDQGEYTKLFNTNSQSACASGSTLQSVKETSDEIDYTSHSHCSKTCTKSSLAKSVEYHFKDILDNFALIELCDCLYQGGYLTKSEMTSFLETHSLQPGDTRRRFLLEILSTRPICKELLRYACFKTKQEHVFEKLSVKKK